ncbi:MAG TPA: Hpt domain-containing protein [Bdellovibrionota bacterium]|nr:Hpt domain-containing protein [Bdellovibrionota bacterium]
MGSVDLSRIRELLEDGGADLLPELIRLYLAETPRKLMGLEAAVAAGEALKIREWAHSLRSTALNLGASRLAELAGELERLGESGETALARGKLEALRREASQVERELRSLPEAA